MKKILLASTALVATAGVASAQDLGIALTGQAEMGIFDGGDDNTQFFTDLDVTFTMTGESDNGISFGATIDLDEATDQPDFENPSVQGGENMFVSFGGATLTMGDTDGAMDAAMPEMALAGGSLNDDETEHLGFDDQDGHFLINDSGLSLDGVGDGQIARFDYTYSAFTFSVSAEQLNNGDDFVIGTEEFGNTAYGIGVNYAGDFSGVAIEAGLGYQAINDAVSSVGLAATAGLANGLSFGATLSQSTLEDDLEDVLGYGDDEITHWGIGIGYEMNAFAVGVNYGEYEFDGNTASGYGLAASYDLGGGLSMRAGYGNSEVDDDLFDDDGFDTYSLGLQMNF
ncbi:porin [Roseivivax sediminis]|uniref:Outer membrane protein OmpU n=1 Tax=Roseivivax sediminis TaxID=936889 RepID=A0A1I1ZL35_9RHOB|nr:porin [Roseivivax sediminis]SFE32068.1 outer membrane protein OmpU [Roseivivax sediminis]